MSVFKDKCKTKDGRQWRYKVYYHNSDGKLVPYTSKRYESSKVAKAEERVFILNRDIPVKKNFDVVANDYFNDAKTRIRESTWLTYKSQYKNKIKPYFENKYIDEIQVIDIENWKNTFSKNMKISSLNQYYVVFKEIFKFANRKYELNYNPVELAGRFKRKNDEVRVSQKQKIRYITYEEFTKFISVIDDDLWHTFFTTLYLTGMRKGEILAIRWLDVDFERKIIVVNKSISFNVSRGRYKITPTKTSVNREITMSNTLIKELKAYKDKMMQYGDFKEEWFVFGNGDVLKQDSMPTAKHKYFELSGVREITIHEFRHSHVSLCINEYLKSGQNDSTKFFLMMSQRMGHGLRVMMEVYNHLFPTTQDKIVDLLNNL